MSIYLFIYIYVYVYIYIPAFMLCVGPLQHFSVPLRSGVVVGKRVQVVTEQRAVMARRDAALHVGEQRVEIDSRDCVDDP